MLNVDALLSRLEELRTEGADSDALLRDAVERMAAEEAERFSWVGIYLLNEEDAELWLHNYVGPHTDHDRIRVGVGVCGTAVAEGANQNIPDVQAIENYLSCSPTVRSELVVLIQDGGTIYGQIDIDSEIPNTFTDEDEAKLQRIADFLAREVAQTGLPAEAPGG